MSEKTRKAQYTTEIKLAAVQQFLNGDKTTRELATELKVDQDTINNWIKKYKEHGKSGLKRTNANPTKKRNKDNKEVKELKAQIKAKDLEIEILKKFQAFLKENE
ncbi:transposase [Alkalihalobacterium chitinilyticum]|uniref:Transposase n=1 Tax=Alkalihalobacterium chitinilyticum TaxID=2980103 RepID=A0ABT5VET9_9BACI|nr:transposase [Alkalihalobacterium chitinilyticum]MDE5413973.1 transposase [Alkalihalobacterium chitinilyticum]